MIHWYLALKRFLRPGTVLLLLLTMLTVWAGGKAGHTAQLRPCGVYVQDSHAIAARVADALAEKGFPIYSSREAMEQDISYGVLDCGAVLLPGLGQAVEAGSPGGNVLLLTAPDSFLTEAYEAKIFAVLYAAAAPEMIRQSAEDAGISLTVEQASEMLLKMQSEGKLFTFEVTSSQGEAVPSRDLGLAIARAAAGLLLCAGLLSGTVRLTQDADALWPRIGRRSAKLRVLLPGLIWQGLFYFGAVAIMLPSDMAALAGFVLLLTVLGLIAGRLPLLTVLPLMLLGALAVFPMYYDLAQAYPAAELLRWVLPPCWLLKALEYPYPAAALGGGLTVLILLFYPKRRRV